MKKGVKIKITRCYFIQVLDKEDYELDGDFCFLSREEAKKQWQKMLERYNKKTQED